MLLYHFIYPAKYRRVEFDKIVDKTLKIVCLDMEI